MNKLLIVFVLLAVFLFADASKCRISRGKAGVVKRCRLSGRRVSVRKCKITSIKGRVAKVCCSKRARIVRRRRASTRRVRRVRRVRRTRRVRRLRFLRRKVRKVRVSRKVVKRDVKRVVTRTIRKIKVIRRKDRKRVKKAVKKAIARALRRKRNVRIAIRRTIRRIVKKIVIRARRPRVSGPAKCAAGQILKFTKTGKRSIKRECVAAKPVSETKVCYGWGDPHYKSENGKTFDNYKQGVWVFAKSEDGVYEVQTTNGLSRAWGTNAVVQRSAIKINGIDIFGINAKTKSVLLNFEALNLKIGQTKMLAAGGAIKRVSAQQYELLSPNGIRTLIDFVWLNVNDYYTNIYTYASADIASQITGFCHGNQNVSPAAGRSYFAKKFVAKVAGKARSWTPKLKAAARAFCAKVAKKQRRQCYRDYRVGGRKLAESAIIIKKDLKKLRNINVNLVRAVLRGKKTVRKPRVYGAKSCPAGQQLRFRKTRRGLKASCRKASTKPEKQCYSVGDPHLSTVERQAYDYQHSGDFLFAQSKGKTFEVQVRQGASPMWRGATLNHRVAVKVNGYDVITLSGKTGTLRVNHKAVQLSPGQSYQFKLGGAIKRLNQQQFEVVGLNGYRSVFSYHIVNAQNYYINLYAYSNGGANLTGLCASKPGAVPPRVPSSLFTKTFIKRRVGKLPKWGRGKKRAAKRLCRHLKGAAKRSCIFDFRVGGKRLAKSDLHVKRNLRLIKRKAHWIRRVARAIRVRL